MPYFWYREEDAVWAALPLSGEPVEISGAKAAGMERNTVEWDDRAGLFRVGEDRFAEQWVLIWGRNRTVRVNGLPVSGGIRVLQDRDELEIGSNGPVFYSAESLARVETFEGTERETFCPRCKLPIEAGSPVVRCPVCLVAYHHEETKKRSCYTYAPTCACGHSTNMNGDLRWTPAESWD